MRSIERKFYKSKIWGKTRKAYINNVNGLCERCLANGVITAGKIVHHKNYLTQENYLDPEISLNFDNLELLCQECHNKEHHSSEIKRRYSFDENGEIKISPRG